MLKFLYAVHYFLPYLCLYFSDDFSQTESMSRASEHAGGGDSWGDSEEDISIGPPKVLLENTLILLHAALKTKSEDFKDFDKH